MFLIIAALLLLAVIGVQNYLYSPLRNETISEGLWGPYHWWLDGAYVVLATALSMAFWGRGVSEYLALGASAALMVTAVTQTFAAWVNKLTNGMHAKLHTWFTVVMLLTVLALECVQGDWKWCLANVLAPIGVGGFFYKLKSLGIDAGAAAEKTLVVIMCAWMIAWSLG